MKELPTPLPTSSDSTANLQHPNIEEYGTKAASDSAQKKRVGVYDRPEQPPVGRGSLLSTVLLLFALLLAVYFLFFANHVPS